MATLRNFAASLKVLIEAQLDVVAQNLSDGRGCVIARLDQLVEAMTVMRDAGRLDSYAHLAGRYSEARATLYQIEREMDEVKEEKQRREDVTWIHELLGEGFFGSIASRFGLGGA